MQWLSLIHICNGYRGSRLTLDNEKIQRTDKIKVSYDFSLYNIINNDGSANVGMPQGITMTSDAVESGSVPYDFNDLSYSEIDADIADASDLSKHLLTFVTGRTTVSYTHLDVYKRQVHRP